MNGEASIADPATNENAAATIPKAVLQPDTSRPRYEAAIPTASKLNTRPPKKENDISTPQRLREPSGAPSTCDPTKPTTPTPAGIVHGQVLVEKRPPINAMNNANTG